MWAIDHRGGLVNLDNAVWIGIVEVPIDDGSAVDVTTPALVAHMVDGTTVTLKTGPKEDLRLPLWGYAERLMLGSAYAATRMEIEAQMRYED